MSTRSFDPRPPGVVARRSMVNLARVLLLAVGLGSVFSLVAAAGMTPFRFTTLAGVGLACWWWQTRRRGDVAE